MGTRPILVSEILSHFELIRDSCIIRWSKERGQSPAALTSCIQEAYAEAESECASTSQSAELQPHVHVVSAMKASRKKSYILSSRSNSLTAAILAACKVDSRTADLRTSVPLVEAIAGIASEHSNSGEIHVIVDTPNKSDMVMKAVTERAPAASRVQAHVGDWCWSNPTVKAKLEAQAGVQLLSDHQLAQLIGVTHVDEVMDCISWQQ